MGHIMKNLNIPMEFLVIASIVAGERPMIQLLGEGDIGSLTKIIGKAQMDTLMMDAV
tara:strand:- start:787 stop:957 length:171 start_codon:yes stop_codon:yes gene_type:complete